MGEDVRRSRSAAERHAWAKRQGRRVGNAPRHTAPGRGAHQQRAAETMTRHLMLIDRAASIAARAHEAQRRKQDATPYIAHPSAVACALSLAGHKPETVAAAFLHDVIEDCAMTADALARWAREVGAPSPSSSPPPSPRRRPTPGASARARSPNAPRPTESSALSSSPTSATTCAVSSTPKPRAKTPSPS